MSWPDILKPMKSNLWLDTMPFSVPLRILRSNAVKGCHKPEIKIGYLEDEFVLYLENSTTTSLKVAFSRKRQNPNKQHDDGYILLFCFTMVGFDEETKVSIMKHDQKAVGAIFEISDTTLAKLDNNHLFELVVVVKILEIKSLDENNNRKKVIDGFMSFLKDSLSEEAIQQLAFILQRPGLKDVFTSRVPVNHIKGVMNIIILMSKHLAQIAEYLKAKSNNEDPVIPDLDVSRLLHYIALGNKETPAPNETAVQQYLIAHKLGLEFYKTLTSDYLIKILEEDFIVLNILEAALFVQDPNLFEKAIVRFLNNFHEIIRSEKFETLSRNKAFVARLIIHAAHIWVSKNDVYIPGWSRSRQPSTEL